MFKVNADSSIFITRGDVGTIKVSIDVADGSLYTFNKGDVVRFLVYEKNDCGSIVLSKSVEAKGGETEIEIPLLSKDTRIGEAINKPKNYWYEVELNPETSPQTVIGYDEDGAKIFRIFPEGEGVLNG